MNIEAIGEGFLELRNISHMGQHAEVRRRSPRYELGARQRHEGRTDAAAFLVRTGIFCRLGLSDDSRPVEVAAMA